MILRRATDGRTITVERWFTMRHRLRLDSGRALLAPLFLFLFFCDATSHTASAAALKRGHGLRAVVPGAGFLLNHELYDFNGKGGLPDIRGWRRAPLRRPLI